VQRYLNQLPYNNEPGGRATLRSFRGVVRHGCAHCLEAALFAAVVLEHHAYPPLVLSFESIDHLDHVIFVFQHGGRWGSVARSRDPGLHGRKPVFASPRALALSYVDPYVDLTGRVTGYAVVDLSRMGDYDWRLAETNVWKVERMLLDFPHRPIASSNRRVNALRAKYRAFKRQYPDRKPLFYARRDRWTELPEGNW
jgi:phosphatidylserine/phosphatidylglycerophosphate/cardiolipin synthase-like enzyme